MSGKASTEEQRHEREQMRPEVQRMMAGLAANPAPEIFLMAPVQMARLAVLMVLAVDEAMELEA